MRCHDIAWHSAASFDFSSDLDDLKLIAGKLCAYCTDLLLKQKSCCERVLQKRSSSMDYFLFRLFCSLALASLLVQR